MTPNTPPAAASTRTASNAGAIVRAARLAAGLTLADLGRRCGYSASAVSRYERGIQPLTDITLLHRLAAALAIPPQAFGLTAQPTGTTARHALLSRKDEATGATDPRVGRDFRDQDGEDPVRRRDLLTAAAGLAGTATLGSQPPAPTARQTWPAACKTSSTAAPPLGPCPYPRCGRPPCAPAPTSRPPAMTTSPPPSPA